jgi:N-acetylmuramic acid 6-phosphate etherase
MISTAVMVKLGHVYGNLMVNVQPTNQKLEDRARRIIQEATGVTYASKRPSCWIRRDAPFEPPS